MLQILQGQVELVRALALQETNDNSGVYAVPKYFCINLDPNAVPQYQRVDSPMTTLPALNADNFVDYADECRDTQGRYNVAIRYDDTSDVNLFTFYGRWDGPLGNKKQERLVYRVYPGN